MRGFLRTKLCRKQRHDIWRWHRWCGGSSGDARPLRSAAPAPSAASPASSSTLWCAPALRLQGVGLYPSRPGLYTQNREPSRPLLRQRRGARPTCEQSFNPRKAELGIPPVFSLLTRTLRRIARFFVDAVSLKGGIHSQLDRKRGPFGVHSRGRSVRRLARFFANVVVRAQLEDCRSTRERPS